MGIVLNSETDEILTLEQYLAWLNEHVDVRDESSVLRSGWAYFANSYRVEDAPPGWNVATTMRLTSGHSTYRRSTLSSSVPGVAPKR